MELFREQDIRVERIWGGESTGTTLVVEHALSGLKVERVIGFDDEGRHRKELLAELSHRFSAQYPPGDFIIANLWLGSGKGAALEICHTPTGLSVRRVVGYDAQDQHRREMLVELFAQLPTHPPTQEH